LRDVSGRKGRDTAFAQGIGSLRRLHATKPSLLMRLRKAGLWNGRGRSASRRHPQDLDGNRGSPVRDSEGWLGALHPIAPAGGSSRPVACGPPIEHPFPISLARVVGPHIRRLLRANRLPVCVSGFADKVRSGK
jgi:hypothetical protein